MDNTQSVTQLAQFQALSSQTQMATDFTSFQSNFAVMQAAGLIGHSVTVSAPDATGATANMTGQVTAIQVINGTPEFSMVDSKGNPVVDATGNPQLFKTSQITGLK
jgi:flagellar hook assembly protein FlgD